MNLRAFKDLVNLKITTSLILLSLSLCQFVSANDTEEANSLQNSAVQLSKNWSKDAYLQSVQLFINSSQIRIKNNQLEEAADCLREASRLLFLLSENETAKSKLEEALEIDKKNNNLSGQAKTLSSLAEIQLTEGDIEKSKELITEAIKLGESSNDYSSQASSLFIFATFLFQQDNPELTVETFLKALSYAEKTNDFRLIAKIQLELSYGYFRAGKYDLALETSQKSLLNWQKNNDKRSETIAQIAIGFHYRKLGNEQAALNQLLLAEKSFPPDMDFIEKARLSATIGAIHGDFGENSKLEESLVLAYNLYKKAGYARGQLAILPNLVETSYLNSKPDKADAYYKEIRLLSKKLNDDFYLGYTNIILGNEKLKNKLPLIAINYYNSALKTYLKYKNQQGIALIYERLGESLREVELYMDSKKKFESSLNINRKTRDKFNESKTLFHLAQLSQLENDHENALNFAKQSIEITENLYFNVANSNLSRSYFSNVYDRYELYINLLMQKHKQSPNEDFAIQALQASEKARSRSLLETLRLSEANFTKDANPELIKREKEIRNLLNLKTDKLTELLSSNTEKNETDKVEDEIRTLNNELEEIKAIFKQNSPIYSAINNPPPFDVAGFQQNILDEKTVLLEFSLGEKESYLWLVGKNEVSSFVLPAREVLENRIDKTRQTFEERELKDGEDVAAYQKRIADLDDSFQAEAKLLSIDLLGQVAEKIVGKRLIVVPDGKLHYLPLSALPFPNLDEPLILHNELVYEPSASLLNLVATTPISKHSPRKDLMVFADPVFSDDDNRLITKNEGENLPPTGLGLNLRDFRLVNANGKLPRLLASQEEANSIAQVVGNSRTTIANGFEANRDRILSGDIADYKILHFATHGLVDTDRPEVSSIVLSQFDGNGNKREGFLRLQDIYALDLGADLIVLSACQSGIGKEIKGEGLMSLNNAFLQTGAKAVLSSSWKVDDYATATIMHYFYQGLVEKGLPPAQALRQAQLKMREDPRFASPFYWAAFTMQGEFRQPLSLGNRSYIYQIGFIVVAIVMIGLLWKFKFSRH